MQPYHLADPTSYEAKLDALLFAQLPWRQGAGTKRAAPPDASEDGDDDDDDGVRVMVRVRGKAFGGRTAHHVTSGRQCTDTDHAPCGTPERHVVGRG